MTDWISQSVIFLYSPMKSLLLILTSSIASFLSFSQEGGENDVNKEAKIKTETIMDIKIKPNKEAQFYFNDKDQFDNGILESAMTEIKVKANVNWQIHVNSSSATFEDGQGNQIPVERFSLAKSGESLVPLTYEQPNTPIATGIVGDDTKETNRFDVDYFANPGYGFAPGVYNVDLVYTISAQ